MKDFKNLNPVDYLRIIWRRRWYSLAAFLLVSGIVCIYAWFTPNIYTSEARILVESAPISQDYVRSSDRASPEERISGILQQLQSRTFMERMVQELQIYGYGTDIDFSMEDTIKALSKSVRVTNTSKNSFIIGFSAIDAQTAQTFTKRMVDQLIQIGNSSRKNRAVETDQFLDEQLRQTGQELATNEQKIKLFKTTHLGELPEQSAANINVLNGLNAQLAAAENAVQQAQDRQKLLDLRAQEQKRLSVLARNIVAPAVSQDVVAPSGPPVNPKLEAKKAELAALTARYTSKHPEVMRLSREVEELKKQAAAESAMSPLTSTDKSASSAPTENPAPAADDMLALEDSALKVETDSIKNEIAKREKEKNVVLTQIKAYQAKLNLAPAIEQEMMSLSREHEVLKQRYTNLQEKKFQAQMTANLENNKNNETYKVIDEANLPVKPAFPNRLQILLMGLSAGFVAGIGAAFGRELLDTTLGGEDEATEILKLPVLATISEIPKREPKRLNEKSRLAKSA